MKIKRFDGVFVEHPSCDGTDAEIISALKCTVSMVSLIDTEFRLLEGDRIVAIVEAMNSHDYSYPSAESG